MRSITTLLAFVFLSFSTLTSLSQEVKNTDEFQSPLGIPLVLSGTFAELRGNHFHGGIDIKTNGKQGYKVYSAKEGFVSRVKVQGYGYGHAIYVEHPNGYTTVYGHLKRFNDEIAAYVKQQQYNQQSFEVDLYLTPGQFPVERGEVIGISGNSGSSGGPHLHFEIRKTNGQIPINPLEFINVKDDIKPTIYGVRVHGLEDSFYSAESKTYNAAYLSSGKYTINEEIIVNDPVVGVSIKAIDQLNGASNKNGFVSLKCYVDDQLNFEYKKEEIPFDKSRFINAHIDYPEKKRGGGTYVNCFKLEGNELQIYNPNASNGKIWLSQYPSRNIRITVCDLAGNESEIEFRITYSGTQSNTATTYTSFMPEGQTNIFSDAEAHIEIPSTALYDDLPFTYEMNQTTVPNYPMYSKLHQIHNETVPLHKFMKVGIMTTGISEDLKSKALMANLDRNGRIDVNTGNWVGNFFQTKTRNFGQFFITTDTEKPKISQLRAPSGNDYSTRTHMQFKISDNLAGIKSYKATVDGQWILMEYDPKRNLLYHVFDARISKGNHQFKLEVSDGVDNVEVLEFDFVR